ncbi:MAG: hypothetical protein ACE5LS_04870 [Thermoplasmata archaeon]
MLTLDEEEPRDVFRQEIVAILHVPRDRPLVLPEEARWREGFAGLREVRSELRDVHRGAAVLRLAVPPFLRAERLREVLAACLERVLGEALPLSLRVLGELAETLQAALEMEEDWIQRGAEGSTLLAFTDEHAGGQAGLLLSELKTRLADRLADSLREVFPLNHHDVLCLWSGSGEEGLSATETSIADFYEELTGGPVSATARPLATAHDLLAFLGS